MKTRTAGACLVGALLGFSGGRAADDVFDRVEEVLTWSADEGRVRAHVSGTLDLEGYVFPQPAPALLRSTDNALFTPRLSVFLDAQLGRPLYFFAQARADRGFDPGENPFRPRLDEYALRYSPWADGRLNIQVGKFATVVGNWTMRHGSWVNPLINAPLPYELLTGVWDSETIRSSNTLLQWSHVRPGLPSNVTATEKRLRLPILWGPSYTIGAAVAGHWQRLHYAVEVKQGALSSRPRTWHHLDEDRDHPMVAGRFAYRPSAMWEFGVSGSSGAYLRPLASRTLPAGRGLGDYRQIVFAQDTMFAWRHVQVWAEVFFARFEIPGVGDADTTSYYVEAKYKFSPRLAGAVRWNQQIYGTIPDRGGMTRWGNNVWRFDAGPAFRFSPHMQAKLQYSLQHGDAGPRAASHTGAGQVTVRF